MSKISFSWPILTQNYILSSLRVLISCQQLVDLNLPHPLSHFKLSFDNKNLNELRFREDI